MDKQIFQVVGGGGKTSGGWSAVEQMDLPRETVLVFS